MKRISAALALIIILFALAGCGGAGDMDALQPTGEAPPEGAWDFPPLVLVNDVLYQIFDTRPGVDDLLDDGWAYVGEVLSEVPGTERPGANFQANTPITGAKLYHCESGGITVRPGGASQGETFFGDSVIVEFEGQHWQYIAPEAHEKVNELLRDAVDNGLLLQVDGTLYRQRSYESGGDFKLDDTYTYLGEIQSGVPENERPAEDFQVNTSAFEIGSEVYRLPPDDGGGNDLVVIARDARYYYREMRP